MAHAGASLVASFKSASDPAAAGPATAALRLALESLDARRKLELLLTPAETRRLLGVLPEAPPSYHYVVEAPAE
jgi:hypothetical protein